MAVSLTKDDLEDFGFGGVVSIRRAVSLARRSISSLVNSSVMHDDLLPAKACVDWAVANLPSLDQRLEGWLKLNVRTTVSELEGNPTHDAIVAITKQPLPLSFSAEVGAYINAIRSSLDILACTVATRHGITNHDNVYFPIVKSEAEFRAGKYKGSEFVKRLSSSERTIVESLKPYDGGNSPLWFLHKLDIARKHQRLLKVQIDPKTVHIFMWGDNFVTPGDWSHPTDNETILAFIKKGAPKPNVSLTPHITLNEPIMARKPLVAALDQFASLAHSIIALFDTP